MFGLQMFQETKNFGERKRDFNTLKFIFLFRFFILPKVAVFSLILFQFCIFLHLSIGLVDSEEL